MKSDSTPSPSPSPSVPKAAAQVLFQTIGPEEAGQRLDNYLLKWAKGVPKSHLYRIIRSGEVRVNKAGCLDRCAGGPVAVVYPEGVWYTFVDTNDIDEIVDSHLKNGQVVQRLLTPEHLGR